MINKFLVFGSCHTSGLELWQEKNIPNYVEFDKLTSALRSDFNESYVKVIQNKRTNECTKDLIRYNRSNSWVSQLKKKYPDSEILNFAIAQSNIANFIKISSYLDKNQINKKETTIIIEITEPIGLTVVLDNMLRSYDKDALEFFMSKNEAIQMNQYLDMYEPPRYRAYLDLIMAKNLITNLKFEGYDVKYFIWDRKKWFDVLHNTSPFEMFMSYDEYINDNLCDMLEDFLKGSILSEEQEIQLSKISKLPQEHFSHEAHVLLGKFICEKL